MRRFLVGVSAAVSAGLLAPACDDGPPLAQRALVPVARDVAAERAVTQRPPPVVTMEPPHAPVKVLLRGKVEPTIQRTAQRLLDLPMGAERIVELGGMTYAFVVEPHYREPGSRKTGPFGWHKGVTVYELR